MSRSVVVRLSMDVANYIANAQKAGAVGEDAMQKVARSAMSADQAVDRVGSTAGKAAAGGLAALFATGKAAMDWESDWASVTKTVSGSADELERIEGDLREMARTMPATHHEIAEVASAAGALGVATPEVVDFTEQMIMLGEATDDLTADEAATQIAQIRNVLQMAPEDVDNFAASLVDLGNNGASTEGQILSLTARVAGAATTIGATEQDTLALAAAMADLGLPPELGGGAMQRVLTMINSEVAKGSEAVADYAEVAGVSAAEFADAWGSRPIEAFDLLVQGLGRVRESGGDVTSVLGDLGIKGTQSQMVMLRMAGAGDGLTRSLEMSGEAWEQNTALIDEFANRAGTTAAEMQVSWNNLVDAGIDLGAVLLPILSDLAGMVSGVAVAINDMPDWAQSALMSLVVGITGGAGLLWALTKIVSGAQAAKVTMEALGWSSRTAATDLDGVGTSATRADKGLIGIAGRATAILAVGTAVGVIADNIGRIDTANLDRSLEAFSRGDATDTMKTVIADLKDLESWYFSTDFFAEVITAGGLFGDTTMDRMENNVDQIDQALARMVESGEAAQAALMFDDIMEQSGLSAEGAAKYFDAYQLAVENAEASSTGAADGADLLGGALDGMGEEASGAEREVKSLADELDALLGVTMDQDEAMVAWKRSIQSLTEELKGGSNALDANTKKGQDNRDAIRDRVGALKSMIEADEAAGVGAKQMERKMLQGAEAIVRAGIAAKISEGEMRGYLRQLGLTPKQIKTLIQLDGVGAAEAQMDWLTRLRTATIQVRTTYSQQGGGDPRPEHRNRADGAVVDYYADGDIRNGHVAEIAPAGSWRVWAEDETGGEAYIPLAASKRDRSIDIWEETGRRLGLEFATFANGGAVGGKRKDSKGRSAWLPDIGEINARALRRMARELERTTNQLERAEGRLDKWGDKMQEIGDATTAHFRPDFSRPDAPTMTGGTDEMREAQWRFIQGHLDRTSGPVVALEEAIAGLEQRQLLQGQLAEAGVDGDAMTELLGQLDNAEIARLLASGQAGQYAKLYGQYAKLSQSVATQAGQYAYGKEYEQAAKAVDQLRAEVQKQAAAHASAEKKWDAWRKKNADIAKGGQSAASRGVQKSKAKTGAKF